MASTSEDDGCYGAAGQAAAAEYVLAASDCSESPSSRAPGRQWKGANLEGGRRVEVKQDRSPDDREIMKKS